MTKLVFTSPDIGARTYRGGDCTLISTLGGVYGSEGKAYFEGFRKQGHYFRCRRVQTFGRRRDYAMVQNIPDDLDSLHLRWDLTHPAESPCSRARPAV